MGGAAGSGRAVLVGALKTLCLVVLALDMGLAVRGVAVVGFGHGVRLQNNGGGEARLNCDCTVGRGASGKRRRRSDRSPV